jgi:quercetin dioxygenase-like cupin family protein
MGSRYDEDVARAAEQAREQASLPRVLHLADQPVEDSRHGRLRHLAHPSLPTKAVAIDAFELELEADGHSSRHRHMGEEVLYVKNGQGYDLHWEVEADFSEGRYRWQPAEEPSRHPWRAGDCIAIPANVVHQHFALGGGATLISGMNRIYRLLPTWQIQEYEPASSVGDGSSSVGDGS